MLPDLARSFECRYGSVKSVTLAQPGPLDIFFPTWFWVGVFSPLGDFQKKETSIGKQLRSRNCIIPQGQVASYRAHWKLWHWFRSGLILVLGMVVPGSESGIAFLHKCPTSDSTLLCHSFHQSPKGLSDPRMAQYSCGTLSLESSWGAADILHLENMVKTWWPWKVPLFASCSTRFAWFLVNFGIWRGSSVATWGPFSPWSRWHVDSQNSDLWKVPMRSM